MAKAKKGDRLSCEVCGLVLAVDKACGCDEAAAMIVCCGKPMGKKAAPRAKKPAKAAAKKPAAKKTVKAKPAKAAAKKPAAKKPARAKK